MTKKIYILLIFYFFNSTICYGQTQSYINLIQQRLDTYFIYPKEAQAKGWEGIVKVKFTIGQDGRIKTIDIAKSSGYPLLDDAAVSTIKNASPYPFPKDYTGKYELALILPIHYYLTAKKEETAQGHPNALLSLEKPQQDTKKMPETISAGTLTFNMPHTKIPISSQTQSLPNTPGTVQGSSSLELASFIDLALKNSQPTKLALQEIELAQFKTLEAKRNFFPNLKLQGYNTTGEVYKVDYEERESKIQIDQPLFTGGKLINTLKQARINLEITKKNYDRLKLDVIQKTETAYYNLIASNLHLKQQMKLFNEAKDLFDKIKKLSDVGMIIPLELTSARVSLQQIRLKMDSIKHDILMAELTFQQVLNIKDKPHIKIQAFEAKRLNNIDLDTCIKTAIKNRPEIYLSKLLVKFNEYGQKIEASKNNSFNVDFTGSYGQYQGHYKTEPWRSSNNFYGGFKVTKPFGTSTVNTSYLKDKTQPRFGQTSPTSSSTLSAELNLFDNLKGLADKKRSDIDLYRALSDFNETIKTITFEVRDAFLNYQKAVLQLNTAQAEIRFRRNELDITKIRALVGEVSISSAMSTIVNLSEAITKYIQALANYQISLANLKKATGYGLQI